MFMRMIYDEKLAQAAYLIGCQRTGEAVVIDPERDVDRYLDLAAANGLRITAVAETHIHADFVSGARELAERVGAKVYVSDEGDADWKYQWLDQKLDGGSYDYQLLKHGDVFGVGNIDFLVVHTPGHTPEHIAFLVTDRGGGADEPIGMVTGDFVFVGDLGRPDLLETAAGHEGAMEPSAKRLFKTVQSLEGVADYVQVWPAHGAGSACGKALGAVPTSTVGYEKRFNPAIRLASGPGGGEKAFVDFILQGQPEPPMYFANMKRDNKVGPRVLGGLPEPRRMTPDELAGVDSVDTSIIDTRSWEMFRDGHIAGSLWLQLGRSFPTDAGSVVRDTDRIYLVVDEDTKEEVIRDLVRVGLDRIVGWTPAAEIDAVEPQLLETMDEVTAGEASRLVRDGAVSVLDVRRATEHAESHLDLAKNISHTRLLGRLDEVPRGGKLLVHCRSGVRSGVASSLLKREGFDVVNMKGGMLAWQEQAGASVG